MSSSPIDLSLVPPPAAVENFAFDALVEEWWDRAVADNPELAGLAESDPGRKWTRTGAFREGLVRRRVNDGAEACMLPRATGTDLENLVALFGLKRETVIEADPDADPPVEAVMESDERLRRRALLWPASISTAGPESAYRFHALNADPRVKDVHVASPAPGSLAITILAAIIDPADTGAAPQALLDTVKAALSEETVRPMGDILAVRSADIVDYRIEATLQVGSGPDSAVVLAAAQAAVRQAADSLHALGRGTPRSVLIAALQAPGVLSVNLAAPAADVAATAVQAARASAIEVSLA
ncbi:MAG: baseplate J/gp47 family protein [Bryobacterales bacterium]|nr:baseplate J/gp47 family protein [Bryobacterales bacterium]